MMDWYHEGVGGAGLLMLLLMVSWVALAFFVVQALWPRHDDRPGHRPVERRSARDVLDERLARGEISVEEYRERLEALRHSRA